jgi:hypothetical protein
MKKLAIIILPIIILFFGFFIPLGSYTTTKGCPVGPTPTQRLHLILGDSLREIKNGDVEPPPNVGCSANTKFVLYLF